MIKKKVEQVVDARENMRGGEGMVKIRHYFKKNEINASCRLCAQLELAPGVSIGLHEHVDEDEIFIIQQGEGVVFDGNKETKVKPGDSILTGGGASHSIKNIGNQALLITAVILQYNR